MCMYVYFLLKLVYALSCDCSAFLQRMAPQHANYNRITVCILYTLYYYQQYI